MRILIYLIILLGIYFTGQAQTSEFKFIARLDLDKATYKQNEIIKIHFEMNQDAENFTPPKFSGFTIVSGPSSSVSSSWVGGQRIFSKKYTYHLRAESENLIIGRATVEYNGGVYKTSLIDLIIENGQYVINNHEFEMPNNPQPIKIKPRHLLEASKNYGYESIFNDDIIDYGRDITNNDYLPANFSYLSPWDVDKLIEEKKRAKQQELLGKILLVSLFAVVLFVIARITFKK